MDAVTRPRSRDSAAARSRRIEGPGTPEAAWQAWLPEVVCPMLDADHVVPPGRRLVVVAPHPDDEVLACGGVLSLRARQRAAAASLDAAQAPVLLIGVTDGEASHPGSRRWTPALLAARRREERASGLHQLGLIPAVAAIGIPDGGVARHEATLEARLLDLLQPGDVVMTTWRFDGHPDHEATGRACARAATDRGSALIEIPVWAWHWASPGDPRVPWHRMGRIPLDAHALERKRTAIAAHESQLHDDEGRPPVLSAAAVERLMRPFEYVFLPEASP